MPIITISRGSFSGGKMLAEALAKRLGYRSIDRDQIIQKAAAWGVSQDDLRAAIERPPAFMGQSQHTKYIYLAFIQAALTEEVRTGNAIYHGLAGHLLLGKGPHVLRTRLIAPLEFRIGKLRNRLQGVREGNRKEAIAYIEKMDEDRRKWTQFLYGIDWRDASLYDLVLNLEQMNLEEACDVICTTSRLKCFASTAETQRALDDLARAAHVKASLAMNPATADLQFAVLAQNGAVSVKGDIVSPAQIKTIGGIVRAVPGVREVHLEQLELA
ncbi:MAG TPA: cytidylate kinase family protein, partial [Candidatus Bathyarchaeia archaeon]|nr:cytidylate kinase family protein [Candidatus Bathyarchaeia archaeon]